MLSRYKRICSLERIRVKGNTLLLITHFTKKNVNMTPLCATGYFFLRTSMIAYIVFQTFYFAFYLKVFNSFIVILMYGMRMCQII
jgi:hypothetical protein